MKASRKIFATAVLFCAVGPAWADGAPAILDPVQVTVTREAEPVSRIPASVSVIGGEELRARGANDLRTALSLVAGVEGTPTGDGGPAGSVPALWGLREVDAFLLVVDGVPWGGAFNPATPSVDMTGVERIEVLRGAAPVMYGTTSFNGVIHIIHYAAGSAPRSVSVSGGSQGSYMVSGSTSLPALGDWTHSLTANVEQRGFKTDREEFSRYHLLYRGATPLAGGVFRLDADASILPQTPGSLLIRAGTTLRTDIPQDANHNPADAKLDQKRFQINASYDHGTALGAWRSTLSLAHTKDDIVRGFLRDDAPTPGADGNDADGYRQEREITDLYFDTHLSDALSDAFTLTYGLDFLYGKGEQEAENFAYLVALDGSNAPDSHSRPIDESNESEAERNFLGLYVQTDWAFAPDWNLLAGLRLNHTQEKQEGEDDSTVPPTAASEKRSKTRLSGVVGVTWQLFQSGNNRSALYADYRNTYKPLALDFGPEAEVDILEPETSNSYEIGNRGALADGRLTYDLSLFQLDFKNLRTFDSGGTVINGGKTRFRGGEIETRYALMEALQVAANYSYHDSRFITARRDNGASVDGNRLETAPFHLVGLGVLYTPPQGFGATLVSNYTGARKLNKSNSVSAGGYYTMDASLSYRFGAYSLHANGYNLTDRRDPVAESELSEVVSGAASYYRLPARLIMVGVSADF